MKRVLLTGATGFVGANLARRLLRDGHELHVLIREAHDPWRIEELRADLELRVVDLADPVSLASVVREIRPDWIFHLAAYGAYASQRDVDLAVGTNVAATIHLVDICSDLGFEAFVNTGSSSEYGFADHAPSEDGPIAPNSLYAVTKAAATLYCQHIARRDGRRIVTLRLYSAYGPWEEPTRLVPQLVLEGLEGRLPPLVSPHVARDFVFVDDICEAYLLAAAGPTPPPGSVYNVGTGRQTRLRDLVALVRRILPIAVEPSWGSMSDRAWDTTVWVADPRRIRDELGWRPVHDLETGLRRTIDWLAEPVHRALYRDRPARGTERDGPTSHR